MPRERFEGPAAEANLGDLQWLLPRVETHDRIIARTMGRAPVFPLRFGTLFSSRQALAIEVARRRRALLAFFAAMEGHEEWAVKALLDRNQGIEARRQALFPESAVTAASGGRNYLLRQRERQQAEQALNAWLVQIAANLEQRLQGLCTAVTVRTPVEPAIGNWACLVAPGGAERLHREIAGLSTDLADQGIKLHCSGPWPLYSFCAAARPTP